MCKSWIGKELVSFSAMQLQKDWDSETMFVSPELGFVFHPNTMQVRLWQEEANVEGLPVSFALRLEKETSKHRPVLFQFNKPFKIRKLEVWTEKHEIAVDFGIQPSLPKTPWYSSLNRVIGL